MKSDAQLMNPTLSICIPTHNGSKRLPYLFESIRRYLVSTNHIDLEVVISNNASDDHTEEVALTFCNEFPEIVSYYRNSHNIYEKNFILTLRRGKGKYRKLVGDTFYFLDGAIELLIQTIRQLDLQRPSLFLTNGHADGGGFLICNDINKFVETASFWTTWIGFLGIWDSQMDSLSKVELQGEATRIPQTFVTLELAQQGHSILVNQQIMLEIDRAGNPNKLGTTHLMETFGGTYLNLLRELASFGLLEVEVFQNEKIKLLADYVMKKLYYQSEDHDRSVFLREVSNYWTTEEALLAYDLFIFKRIKN